MYIPKNSLHIDFLIIPGCGGSIGMTSCPGKKCSGLFGGQDRDLADDLATIREWGAEVLVSLIEDHEYQLVGLSDFEGEVPSGILHLRLPISDGGVPDATWEKAWAVQGELLRSVLRRGGKICIHCMGGLGRTGTIAARLLVEFGIEPARAIELVRDARPGAIENSSQEEYILAL